MEMSKISASIILETSSNISLGILFSGAPEQSSIEISEKKMIDDFSKEHLEAFPKEHLEAFPRIPRDS